MSERYINTIILLIFAESKNHNVFNNKGIVAVQGKNLQILTDMISNPGSKSYVDIVDGIFCTPRDDNIIHFDYHNRIVHGNSRGALLYVVQLCLAPYYLGPTRTYRQRHFDVSQYQTYNFQQPLFVGENMEHVNVRLLLHMVNFFQFHLKAKDEGLLAYYYPSLAPDQVPRPWTGTIRGGAQTLGQHWKGIYSKSLTSKSVTDADQCISEPRSKGFAKVESLGRKGRFVCYRPPRNFRGFPSKTSLEYYLTVY